MDDFELIKGSKNTEYFLKNKKLKICLIFVFFILIIIYFLKFYIKIQIKKNIKTLNDKIFYYLNNKEKIIENYIIKQNNFCDYSNKYINYEYEKQIKLANFSLKDSSFKIYVYKKDDYISKCIIKKGNFENNHLLNIIKTLNYYSKKNNIKSKKDILVLDIGGNIGVYSIYLGNLGYSVLSFEPSPRNFYILNKNYCLNKNNNTILINEGLSTYEKTCDYYSQKNNIGNGILFCNKIDYDYKKSRFFKQYEVTLTKLSNFIPYLINNNLVLIKIDIEGSEGQALLGGFDLITKYHVPYIFLEFTPMYLKKHGTNPRNFLKMFADNGYKISLKGFLSNSFVSVNQVMKLTKIQLNLYFIYLDK